VFVGEFDILAVIDRRERLCYSKRENRSLATGPWDQGPQRFAMKL
jgi:hypothetical protein